MLSFVLTLVIWINYCSAQKRRKVPGDGRRRLINRLDLSRRLISINFNDKICVDFGGFDWLTPYSGEYTYTGSMENNKPLYQMTKCHDDTNCHSDSILRSDSSWGGQWRFIYGDNGPLCNDLTDTPQECNNWWGGRNPTIYACGNTQTADNGLSQEETDKQNACKTASELPKRNYLTSSDKDEILRQFNVQRGLHSQPSWSWSNALEQVALATGEYCQYGHPLSGERAKEICEQYSNNDPNCWAAGFQGGSWSSDNVEQFLWDGYKNGDCVISGISTKGIVWSFMQDDHRRPITGEEDTPNHKFTKVGCAYHFCAPNGGYFYCNYM